MLKRILSAPEQVAASLRDEIARGRWIGTLPGIYSLSAELGFPRKPIEQALLLLEKEGLLFPQGVGRRRKIAALEKFSPRSMRVAILDYDPSGIHENMTELLNRLSDQGHTAFFSDKTLMELDMNVARIARLVKKTEADIWIVIAGPTEVLDWFDTQKIPVFSIFGNFAKFQMAGIGISYAKPLLDSTRRLIELGHRRIVYMVNRGRVDYPLGSLWKRILEEMETHGIITGTYNLPKWEDSSEGFYQLLKSLFAHTPPTALVIEEIPHFVATLQFCAEHGLRVPHDVSLICLCYGSDLDYCYPAVTHIHWDYRPMIKRITEWANHMVIGKQDHRQSYIKANFVIGGTIGAALQ